MLCQPWGWVQRVGALPGLQPCLPSSIQRLFQARPPCLLPACPALGNRRQLPVPRSAWHQPCAGECCRLCQPGPGPKFLPGVVPWWGWLGCGSGVPTACAPGGRSTLPCRERGFVPRVPALWVGTFLSQQESRRHWWSPRALPSLGLCPWVRWGGEASFRLGFHPPFTYLI